MRDAPITIVGGGPVGLVLALLLDQRGIASQIFEARPAGAAHHDTRALALSYGSRLIFERVGVWSAIAPHATAINTIHISQQGSLGRSRLHADEYGLEALGYVVSYGALCAAMDAKILQSSNIAVQYETQASTLTHDTSAATVTLACGQETQTVTVPLVVIADGGRSASQLIGAARNTKAYGHDALVTKVAAELPHDNIAYERFTPQGPMALLPNGAREFSLVWTGPQEKIADIMTLADDDFLEALHQHFGDRVGRFLKVEKRLTFPLMMAQLETAVSPRVLVIGNAAQTMHPVAGQGFNVGLRDAASLAKLLAAMPQQEWGSADMLAQYLRSRATDTKRGLLFTDFLVSFFSNERTGLHALRSMGLGLFDLIAPAKRLLVRKMSFGK